MKTLWFLWIVYSHSGAFFPKPFQDLSDCEAAWKQMGEQHELLRDWNLGIKRHQCIAIESYWP